MSQLSSVLPFDETGLTVLTGGLGCGKTEIAVNLAFSIFRLKNRPVSIIDLDNIKPYLKARNLDDKYRISDIRIIAPEAGYSDADLPILPPEARSVIKSGNSSVIVDVGGDEAGARILGGYAEDISPRDYNLFFVINISRPYLKHTAAVINMISEVENQSGLKVTGLINNTHLMWDTDEKIIENGRRVAMETALELGVPFAFTCVHGGIDLKPTLEPVFKLDLYFLNRDTLQAANLARPKKFSV